MTSLHDDEDDQEANASADVVDDEYRAVLHRFLMRHLHNAQDAYDLAQEAYTRFYQLPKEEVVRKPRSYLFRIAQNLVYEFRLRQRRENAVLTMNSELFEAQARRTIDPANPDPGDLVGDAQLLDRILMQIPPGYRKVLILQKRDGLSCAQIAARMGITSRSVEIYVARALAYARMARWM